MGNKKLPYALAGLAVVALLLAAFWVVAVSQLSAGAKQSQAPTSETTTSLDRDGRGSESARPALFERQQMCGESVSGFQQIVDQEASAIAASMDPKYGWRIRAINVVTGYSPSLQTCIGAYTMRGDATTCPSIFPEDSEACHWEMYEIKNIATNKSLGHYSSPNKEYNVYRAKLSELTDGQLK
jgi:hypothetical protein